MKDKSMEHYIILAPHPDDELLMAGYYTLLPNSSIILITDGGDTTRVAIFDDIIKRLNKPSYKIVFPSMYILTMDKQLIYKELLNKINDIHNKTSNRVSDIYYLVIPSTNDTHPEHLLISALGMRIGLELDTPIIFASATKGHEHMEINNTRAMKMFKTFYHTELTRLQITGYDLSNKIYIDER